MAVKISDIAPSMQSALCRRLVVALMLAAGASSAPSFVQADELHGLPFWGHPYPFGYAYTSRLPPLCWVNQRVDGFFGPHYERVWVCGNVVTARY